MKQTLLFLAIAASVFSAQAGIISSGSERKAMPVPEVQGGWLGDPTSGLQIDKVLGQSVMTAPRPGPKLAQLTPLGKSDPLPETATEGLSFSNATLAEALSIALDPIGIGWVIQADTAMRQGGEVKASLAGLSGNLSDVITAISDAYGVHWQYSKGRVTFSRTQSFAVLLPPAPGIATAVLPSVKGLGAQDAVFDPSMHALVFTATPEVSRKVEQFVQQLIKEQRLVFYEIYAFQVDLGDDKQLGIAWDKLNWSDGTTTVDLGKVVAGVGAVSKIQFSTAKLGADILLSFLKEQGDVKVLSKPVGSVLSGQTQTFRHGESFSTLSKLLQTKDAQGNTSPTVEESIVKTGFEMKFKPHVRENTVFMDVELFLNDLVSLNETKVGDSIQLNLPHTKENTVKTTLTAESGQAVILGGVVTERDDIKRSKFLFFNLSEKKTKKRSELVFYIKPTVAEWSDPPSQ